MWFWNKSYVLFLGEENEEMLWNDDPWGYIFIVSTQEIFIQRPLIHVPNKFINLQDDFHIFHFANFWHFDLNFLNLALGRHSRKFPDETQLCKAKNIFLEEIISCMVAETTANMR